MHLHFERNANAKCDCAILSLTWMGKVPDELPEDEGWKLNRTNYYQEGWLATGNVRGIVGVTFTTSHCKKSMDSPLRTNYNLRGHRSEVILVKWNEPYQKLASCDSSGIIFVWIKYEGRWSIELINDRNTPVTHFAWSHDGRMALICYQDGFVLVGSVAGQRYWSSMLNLDSTITCGIWTPDDLHVYFGTSHGGLVVMDVHGAMVAQVALAQAPVTGMAWSCEKFKMEEGDDGETQGSESGPLVLAVSVSTGHIYLMKSYDDISPITINTGLGGPLCMEWSNSRQLLAVAGVANHSDHGDYTNMLKCYSDTGVLLYTTLIPFSQSPVSALTWGHNDKRLFVATGGVVHIAWVSRRVASLQLLSRLQVATSLPLGEVSVKNLPLPPRLKHLIGNLFTQTIRCCVPEMRGIREFVSRAPVNGTRLHCTMIRHDDDHISAGTCYTLYLEYLGGLVPLLKGKRTSKIRPEFVIFDPQIEGDAPTEKIVVQGCGSDTSDTEKEDGCGGSPRPQRRRRKRHKSPTEQNDNLTYVDTLSESARLVEVTSNIWGTKFKIHGLADCLPSNLGQVTYKTSLLHLQPRQMSLVMTELSDDILLAPDPTFNPNVFSEDEEDPPPLLHDHHHPTSAIPIAPMTPKNFRQPNGSRFLGEPSTSPRFIHARPHLQRNISLQRNNTQGEIPTLAATLHRNKYMQERLQKILDAKSTDLPRRSPLQRNLSFLEAQNHDISFQTNEQQPSTSQPSPNCDNNNTLATYQSSSSTSSSSQLKSPLARPESIEDEASYIDCNLTEVINFCENYKIDDNSRTHRPKLRQERAETSFLNHPVYPTDINIKFIDEESGDRMTRSCSVGFLDDVDTGFVPCDMTLSLLKKDSPKRLVLVRKKHPPKTKSSLSLDSSDLLILRRPLAKDFEEKGKPPAASSSHCVVERLPEPEPVLNSPRLPRSQPVSPALGKKVKRNQSASPIRKHILNSPLLRRRRAKSKAESSDDEVALSGDEAFTSKSHYKDLETFQKAQLRQKLKRGKVGDGHTPRVRELVMHNKAPMWNENSQVYQLDFGGRVTQESAKNFQIEFKGKQVMQFGRIDGNAYTLDFQYPFSVLQAFAVALANVTQRLK